MWEKLKIRNGKDIQNWIEVEDRKEVECLTLSCMKKHFKQVEGTPLPTNHWSSQLIDEEFIEQIKLENHDKLNHESEEIRDYFKAMAQPRGVSEMKQFQYDFKDWKAHIQRVKGKTSTSPSRRHYGHLKVLMEKAPEIFHDIYTPL